MLYNAALGQRPPSPPPDNAAPSLAISPSAKLLKPFYWIAAILAALIFFYSSNHGADLYWLLIVPGLIAAWAIARSILLRFTKLVIIGGKLRYETGVFSRSVRTMEIFKVQDVVVNQSFFDRILNLGTISIETAGETSRLSMAGVEEPQRVAEYILNAAHK